MSPPLPMVEVRSSSSELKLAYQIFSRLYGYLIAPLEIRSRRRALQLAGISESDRVLEVAVGSGNAFLDIARQKGTSKGLSGIDLTPGMIRVTRKRMNRKGFSQPDLREADARHLPYPDHEFDLVFSSNMIDLIPSREIDTVLGEFSRVLRPGGRIVLVHMSKRHPDKSSWYEWAYTSLPRWFVTFLLGGCRPVALERHVRSLGYGAVRREYYSLPLFCEIIFAVKQA